MRTCLSEASFRGRRPHKPVTEASIMLSGAARSEARSNCMIVSTRTSAATQDDGMRRRVIVQFGDAQGTRGAGVFFWFVF